QSSLRNRLRTKPSAGLGRHSHPRDQTHSEIGVRIAATKDDDLVAVQRQALCHVIFVGIVTAIMTSQVLSEKVGVVFGVANKRSIAWAIAKEWAAAGARLIFNFHCVSLMEYFEELVGTICTNV